MKFLAFLLILGSAAIMVACRPIESEINPVEAEEKANGTMEIKQELQRDKKHIHVHQREKVHSVSFSVQAPVVNIALSKSVVQPRPPHPYLLQQHGSKFETHSFATNTGQLHSSMSIGSSESQQYVSNY